MPGLTARAWWLGTSLAAPALRRMLRRRVARGKEDGDRLGEREGIDPAPRPPGPLLWLHAASVGEALSVLPVLASLGRAAPGLPVLFTTGTLTSARLLAERLPALGLPSVQHRFVPLDVPRWTRRFLDHWRPSAAVFVESELWPNLIAACRARAVPLMLLNGRVSARSFRGWRLLPGFARELVGAFDLVHPQSAADAGRLRTLGARAVLPPGNLKWCAPLLPVDPAEHERWRRALAGRPVWLAASTHPGEEEIVARVHAALLPYFPGLLTIVAPRHPGRGAAAATALRGAERRTQTAAPASASLFVVDTMGEMGLFYSLAPVVFVGGSLVRHGGQNPLEPARFGCAVAAGPHTGNFAEITAALEEAGALARVADAAALTRFVATMLRDDARAAPAAAARAVADREAELPDRVADAMLGLLR